MWVHFAMHCVVYGVVVVVVVVMVWLIKCVVVWRVLPVDFFVVR